MFFVMRAYTVAYIWKKFLTAAVELPKITECGWQSNSDINCLDEAIPTEIEELLVILMMTWNTCMGMRWKVTTSRQDELG